MDRGTDRGTQTLDRNGRYASGEGVQEELTLRIKNADGTFSEADLAEGVDMTCSFGFGAAGIFNIVRLGNTIILDPWNYDE